MTKEYDFEATLEEMTSPSTFDLKAALAKKTSPTDTVTVFLDGETMHEANIAADGVLDAEIAINTYTQNQNKVLAGLLAELTKAEDEASGGITESPDKPVIEKKIAKHKKDTAAELKKLNAALEVVQAEVDRLDAVVKETALTFKVRGLAPKQSELIVSKWQRAIKLPSRGDYETETEFSVDYNEQMRKQNRAIVVDQMRTAFVSVTGSDLVEHQIGWTYSEGVEFWDEIDDSERAKINTLVGNLTFANTLFSRVATEDADFLPSR